MGEPAEKRAPLAADRADLARERDLALAQCEIMYRLVEATNGGVPLPTLLDLSLEGLEALLGAERSAILLLRPDGAARVGASRGLSADLCAALAALGPSLVDDLVTGPVVISDVEADPGLTALRPILAEEGVRALVLLPLLDGDRLLGRFFLCYRSRRTLEPAEALMARAISHQVSACIERARARSVEQERAREAALRAAIGEVLARDVLPLRSRLARCACALAAHVPADQVWIWQRREEDDTLVLQASAGKGELPDGAAAVVSVGKGPIGMAAAGHLPHLTEAGHLAVCAIRSGRRLHGVVAVRSAQPMDLAALPAVQGAADSIAQAVSRALDDAEREQLLASTQRYARMMEVFVGVLSHDLRNPLSAIATATQLLTRSDRRSELAAAHIRQASDRMGRMIDQLLDFTRIRMGQGLPLDLLDMDLGALGRQCRVELEVAYPQCQIRLEERGDLWGRWDRDRLAQLLSNLGGNACQHGAADAAIVVAIDGTDPQSIRIAVHNGGAIPPELVPTLFEPGVRGSAGGLGLGLYISQQIALAHGGEIDVSADSGCDRTCVTATFPRRPPANEPSRTFRLDS